MKYLVHNQDGFLNSINNEINSIIHRNFDNLFPEFLFHQDIDAYALPVDLKETDKDYLLKVEIPGIKKEDICVEINKNSVKITAKKDEEKIIDNSKYHRTEIKKGNFMREIYFPLDVDSENSSAELKHGVLNLVLVKKHQEDKNIKKLEIR